MRAAPIIAAALLALPTLGACGPKSAPKPPIEEDWTATREGRNTVRLDLVETMIEAGRIAEAKEVLRQAIEEGADPGEVALLQGRAMMVDGLSAEAESLFEEAKQKLPRDPRPLRYIALLQADSGRTDLAIENLELAVKLAPTDAASWNNLGFLYLSERRYEEAQQALAKAVALDGTPEKYRLNLGFALAATGRDGDALDAFRSAGTEADAHANLGLAMEMRGDSDKAALQYQKALNFDSEHDKAQEGLARTATTEAP